MMDPYPQIKNGEFAVWQTTHLAYTQHTQPQLCAKLTFAVISGITANSLCTNRKFAVWETVQLTFQNHEIKKVANLRL